jgi:energy-coupling factor transport system substrate-specific component
MGIMSTATSEAVVTKPKRTINVRWRVVDIVVAAVIGVAAGLVFFAWNQLYNPLSAPLEAALPGLQSLVYGVWLFAGVLGGLVIRKPGAAIFVEIVAATVSSLLGAQWGLLTLESGLVQGLGAELIFLIFFYANWRAYVAVLAGAASGLALAINDLTLWYPGSGTSFITIYTFSAIISGAVIAGLGSWLITRGLAKTGALSRFASGREATVAV